MDHPADRHAIDELAKKFFALFSNRDGVQPDLERIFELFVRDGVIARYAEPEPEVWTPAAFIVPRRELLTNGTLLEFSERETSERTAIFGALAQRVSTYAKSGVRDGVAFSARGLKIFQFVRTSEGWRILSVLWDDERPGFVIDDRQL